jgi:hypothetical protein
MSRHDKDTSTTAFAMRGGISGGTFATVVSSIEDIPTDKLRASHESYALCSSEYTFTKCLTILLSCFRTCAATGIPPHSLG